MIRLTITIFLLVPFLISSSQSVTYKWKISQPVLSQGISGSVDEIAVKDPSVVFFENKWHLFYTARSENEYTTGYVAAESFEKLNSAKRHELEMIRGETRYGCAPQVFYFEPQKLWYLIYQNRDANYQPVFSTNTNISKPENWTTYKNLIEKDSPKKWIDFWIIADKQKVYLFYTIAHGGIEVRSTSFELFPKGWSKSKKVFDNIHEAAHIYKVKGENEFHMIYELNNKGVRSFGLATAEHLEGPWEKVTDNYATGNQLIYSENQKIWTEMVSHGEVIRSGFNELMEYEPENCRWLIQGIRKEDLNTRYEMLPWQLGIIQLTNNEN